MTVIVFLFGLIAGIIVWKSKNICGSILAHGMFDTVISILFFIYPIVPGIQG